jgi:hypothetical protein
MELHGSFPLARLVKNKVSLCETQYAEAGAANGVRETPTSKPLALGFTPSQSPAGAQRLPNAFPASSDQPALRTS